MRRTGLIFVPLALLSAPSFAQAAEPAFRQGEEISIPVVDPETASKLADAAQALSKVVLDIKVGGVEAAIQGRRPTPRERNQTVRDLARRDDPHFEDHLDRQIAAAKPKIEQSVRAFNEAIPGIEESLSSARRSIERAMANMPDPNYPKR